jgi:hypothetical protein
MKKHSRFIFYDFSFIWGALKASAEHSLELQNCARTVGEGLAQFVLERA